MIGDRDDMASRMRAVLPARWFGDAAPVLDGVLGGMGEMWSRVHALLQRAVRQTRLATADGAFVDMIAQDFFGRGLRRRLGEADDPYRVRIAAELLRERGTRHAVVAALEDLTGRLPVVFEPARPADTGGWGRGGAYGSAGGWGSLDLPMQCFVTAFRPAGQGIRAVAGWGDASGAWGGGALKYASLTEIAGQVTDADIAGAVAGVMPVASIAWLRISS
jgi:hypothetical protein